MTVTGPDSGFLTTADGVGVAYDARGNGPPLVYVRGWVSHLDLMWRNPRFRGFFSALAEHRRVVRFDARGNGLSEAPGSNVTLDGLVADLEAVIDRLGLERVELLGDSFGGPIAIRYTARHPARVSALVLANTYASLVDEATPQQREAMASIVSLLRSDPVTASLALAGRTSPRPEGDDSAAWGAAKVVRTMSPRILAELYETGFTLDVSGDLAAIVCPTLVLHRVQAQSVPVALGRRLAARLASSHFVELPGASANLWEDRPEDALLAICEFLAIPLDAGRKPLANPSARATLTLMFTDIESSTAFTRRVGDERAQDALRQHNRVVRDILAEHGGREIKHTGDGIMASFPSALSGVSAALEIQGALADGELKVRIGLNAGEPVNEDGDLFGTAVQLAARITARAAAGQVLVSRVVAELCAGKGLHFISEGEAQFKGFDEPVAILEAHA